MRLLYLCHAHPSLQTGGTEIFARDLFRRLCREPGMRGLFLAGATGAQRPPVPGCALQAADGAADEMLLWTGGFDSFFLSQIDLHGVPPALEQVLAELQPDVVHFHHLLTLGCELPAMVRRLAPRAAIVLTLHDYYPLCAHDGQMVTPAGALCHAASLDACRKCLPERSLTDFRLRRLHVEAALGVADMLVAPSVFLRDRFVAAGVPAGRIRVLPNGVPAVPAAPHRQPPGRSGWGRSGWGPLGWPQAIRRDRFGFFGHLNRFKGATVALEASASLSGAGVAHSLALHGGDDHQTEAFREQLRARLAAAPDARRCNAYARADLPRLMAGVDWVLVPSVWWENAPLVIQEAFRHRRPVICSDVGGMAEMVRDGIDGLHAPLGDPAGLAEVMRRAASEPGLWRRLVRGITPPPSIAQSASQHLALYHELLAAGSRLTADMRTAA
jgi:glycosyltransferase involved in cell wall biosynthesis